MVQRDIHVDRDCDVVAVMTTKPDSIEKIRSHWIPAPGKETPADAALATRVSEPLQILGTLGTTPDPRNAVCS